MYTYLKFGLPRVFPPNAGSQRSHHRPGGPGGTGTAQGRSSHGGGGGGVGNGGRQSGQMNRAYRDSSAGPPGAGSSGYDSSDNETTRGGRATVPTNLRKFRSESDFRAVHQQQLHHNHQQSHLQPPQYQQHQLQQPSPAIHSRLGSQIQGNNIPLAALRMANSRASIAGTHINQFTPNGKHYGTRSHSEADLLANDMNAYEYDMR